MYFYDSVGKLDFVTLTRAPERHNCVCVCMCAGASELGTGFGYTGFTDIEVSVNTFEPVASSHIQISQY